MKTNPDGFSGVQLFLAGLGGAAIGAIGMAMSRPRTTQPAGGVLPAGQSYRTTPVGRPPFVLPDLGGAISTDQYVAQFLGRAGYSCQTWEALSLAQKRQEVSWFLSYGSNGQTLREYHAWAAANPNARVSLRAEPRDYDTDSFIHMIDAHCLKMAIQAQNMPHAARPMPALAYR